MSKPKPTPPPRFYYCTVNVTEESRWCGSALEFRGVEDDVARYACPVHASEPDGTAQLRLCDGCGTWGTQSDDRSHEITLLTEVSVGVLRLLVCSTSRGQKKQCVGQAFAKLRRCIGCDGLSWVTDMLCDQCKADLRRAQSAREAAEVSVVQLDLRHLHCDELAELINVVNPDAGAVVVDGKAPDWRRRLAVCTRAPQELTRVVAALDQHVLEGMARAHRNGCDLLGRLVAGKVTVTDLDSETKIHDVLKGK